MHRLWAMRRYLSGHTVLYDRWTGVSALSGRMLGLCVLRQGMPGSCDFAVSRRRHRRHRQPHDGATRGQPAALDGIITEINTVAEHLLGVTMDTKNGLAFADAFPGVPMPDETQSMVHGQFTRAGRRLDVVFTALGDGTFAAVLRPVDRERAL